MLINTQEEDLVLEYTKSLTLLCVEDNKTAQIMYESILEDIFEKIIFANDGCIGYEEFINNKIDMVITDYKMPNLDGLEMIEKIRKIDRDIPIVLISAIEDIDIIVKAFNCKVSSFIKKPIISAEVFSTVMNVTRLIIANNFLREKREAKLKKFQDKEKYNSYQEYLGFAKELNILRNDFYYKMKDSNGISLIDFLYKPLDVMSGDAYSARIIDSNRTFYLMVDGMGKGVSASLTAMIITSFINYLIDKMLLLGNFDLNRLIYEAIEYIKPVLLDEEALAIDFVLIDNKNNMLHYSKFAMPVLLMQTLNYEIIRLKSNNPPLSKWQSTFKVDSYDISKISKYLIYTDGIIENETICDNKQYSEYIENDLLNSFTREDFKNSFFEKVVNQEDDLTLIFIHKLNFNNTTIIKKEFNSTLKNIDIANDWYEEILLGFTDNKKLIYNATVVFTELFMNAHEHGNLGIDSQNKHRFLEDNTYFDILSSKELECDKMITVKINKIDYIKDSFIITQIIDDGDGFDTDILSDIFRNSQKFNGRGVFVSRKNSSGIYYNSKGNSVLFLNKI